MATFVKDLEIASQVTVGSLDITGSLVPEIINAATGTVKVTFPAAMYTGPIIPDARKNVPIVIFGFTWNIAATPTQTFTHRWAFIQCYEPDVAIANPVLDPAFVALVVA